VAAQRRGAHRVGLGLGEAGERLDGVQQRDPVASVLRDPDAFGVQRARADEVAALDRQVGEAMTQR